MSKAKPTRHAPQEVDVHLASAPEDFSVAPGCTQWVSYKIPIFRLKREFVAISAAKKHVGLHTMSKAIPVAMKDELMAEGIWISGTTFQIKPGMALPEALLERALQARLAELESG